MKDITKYRRGQVYFLRDSTTTKGSIQSNYRPHLIVSNDMCNMHSPVLHMAPITSRSKTNQPTHVEFVSDTELANTILVEQIKPITVSEIESVGEYMYTLSDSLMTKVDRAISIQFGLNPDRVPWDNLEDAFNKMKQIKLEEMQADVFKLAEERAHALFQKFLEEFNVSKQNDTYKEQTPVVEVSEPKPKEIKKESQIDKFNKKYESYLKSNPSVADVHVTITRTPSGRIKWTDELKKQYLRDCEFMSKEDIMQKYGVSEPMYYQYRKKFKEADTSPEQVTTSAVQEVAATSEPTSSPLTYPKNPKEIMKIVNDYNSMTLSDFMSKYNISSRKEAVQYGSWARNLIDVVR